MSRCSPGCAPAPNVVPVVEAAAVIGRHVDRGLLCSVVDLSDDEVDDVIDELEDALVLEPWGTDGWRFRHELLREVAAELAPPSVRRGLHAKVADALVERRGRRPGLAAGRRPLRARRAVRRGGLGLPAGVDRCPPPRRARRGPHLPHPRPHAARARHTRPGPRPPRDRPAVGAGIPRRGRRGLSKPRRRRRLRALPAAGRHRSARRPAVRDADRPVRLLHPACRLAPGCPAAASRCAPAPGRGGSGCAR